MMPSVDPREERRKKLGCIAALIGSVTVIVSSLFHPGWTVLGTDPRNWVLLATGTVIGVAVAVSADLPAGSDRGDHGEGSGRRG
jgi:hypothetical protein